jgi:hypothetical protein
MIDEENQKKLIDKAKEIFGITESCKRAGYILPNGEMLDFGNPDRKEPDDGIRFQDHSEVWQVYSHFPEIPKLKPFRDRGQCFYGNYNDQWLKETGAIRLSAVSHYQMTGEMFQPNKPTRKQMETLEYCTCVLRPTEKIIMEFAKCDDEGHYTPKHFEEPVRDDCVEPINDLNTKIKASFT